MDGMMITGEWSLSWGLRNEGTGGSVGVGEGCEERTT